MKFNKLNSCPKAYSILDQYNGSNYRQVLVNHSFTSFQFPSSIINNSLLARQKHTNDQ